MELKNRANRLLARSIEVLRLLCFENGAIIAAPTSHASCNHIWEALGTPPLTPEASGYHRVWVRDGTYIAMALDAIGDHDRSRRFYEWCMQVQDPSGCWLQCYLPDGRRAIDGLEMDEVGTPIFGAINHYLVTRDNGFLSKAWPMTKRAAAFLTQNLASNGLMNPSYDLWEERWGHHLYSNVAAAAGLLSASYHAEVCGERSQIEDWRNASEVLKKSIFEKFLLSEKGSFARSIDPVDSNIDVSVLSLVFPFSLLPPKDIRIQRTVEEIEAKLVKGKGVMRYSGDKYDGIPEHHPWRETEGNLWVPATLWLALYYIKARQRRKARRLYNWVVKSATDDFLLPQQVDKNGRPISAIPYGLAHALFILTTLQFGEPYSSSKAVSEPQQTHH